MKLISTLVCLLVITGSNLSGQVSQQWLSSYTQTAGSDDFHSKMVIDASGNSYVTGWSYLPAGGNYVTVKYNSAGVEQWAAVYNGAANGDDHPTDLGVDASGNVYVTGSSFSGSNINYVTVKYNSSGVQQWAVSYNGTGNGTDDAYAIAVDPTGNSYVTGRAQGVNGNFATVKYNTAGTQLWVAIYNGIGNNSDGANAIAIDGAGNSYVTGYSANGTNMNYATVMYNTSGVQQWATVFNGAASLEDRPSDIAVDGSGNTYVTGFSYNASNNKDYATVKYNSAGVQQWVSLFNRGTDEPAAIVADATGNTYVTGYSIASTWDYATVMYNTNGVQQWATMYDTFFGDVYAEDVAIDGSGNAYVTGNTGGAFATVKYSGTGVQQWIATYTSGTDGAKSIAVDGTGNVYVSGDRHNGSNNDLVTIKYAPIVPLSASQSQTNVTCASLCNGSATVVAANGVAPYSYSWSPSGGTSATTTGRCAGTYTCTITDNVGATITQTFSITEPTAVTASSSATAIQCNGGTASVTVTGSGGSAPYTGTGTFVVTTGTHSYTVTDANSCATTTSVTVTQPTALAASSSATSILCNGGTSTITVSGSGGTVPYTGTGTFVVAAGTHSYSITDSNNCVSTTSVTVTQPTALAASSSSTSVSCNGGTAIVTVSGSGGISPYSGTGTFTVTAGTYSYTVTDNNGCTTATSITITEPSVLTSSSSATSIACNGGTATVTVSGSGGTFPYTGEGSFTEVAGIHSYTVTDNNGCTSTTSMTITEPTVLTSSSSATSIACNGGTATVTVNGSGGTLPYTGEGTFTVTAGTYIYTVTDNNACSSTSTITVTEPAVLSAIVVSLTDPSTCSGTDGAMDITPAGGTIPYSFLWNNSLATEDITALVAGSYSCTITDADGCTTTLSGALNDPNAPTVTLTLAMDTLCVNDGSFTLSGESPVGGTFSGPGITGNNFDPATAGVGTHNIAYIYTDVNGCTGSTSDSLYADVCLEAQNALESKPISVYPNPSDGVFTITAEVNSTITVYDIAGQPISEITATTTQTEIDLGAFADGVYFIMVRNETKALYMKIQLVK